MIRINDGTEKFKSEMISLCADSPFGARILSYVTAYDNKYSFIDSWLCTDEDNKSVCAVCRYYDTVMICGHINNETAMFISALSPKELIFDGESDLPIDMTWSHGMLMKCENPKKIIDKDKCIVTALDGSIKELRNVYYLMSDGFGFDAKIGFEDFAVDMSHRIRHKTAAVYVVYMDNKIVSSLIVPAITPKCAMISGVVTRSEYRRQGIGSFLVSYVTSRIISQGKTVYLQTEKKISIYDKIGFTVCKGWKSGRM